MKCSGFSSTPKMRSAKSLPIMREAKWRTLMTFSHIARSRDNSKGLEHLARWLGFRKTTPLSFLQRQIRIGSMVGSWT